MKIVIAALLAGAALSLAACHSKAGEDVTNVATDNGTGLNVASSEGFDNGETVDNAVLDNGAEAANVSEAGATPADTIPRQVRLPGRHLGPALLRRVVSTTFG